MDKKPNRAHPCLASIPNTSTGQSKRMQYSISPTQYSGCLNSGADTTPPTPFHWILVATRTLWHYGNADSPLCALGIARELIFEDEIRFLLHLSL